MADITSPIALDESFNTTETTPRNIADVVADETGDLVTQATAIVTKLQALINAVKPNASDIPLDPITGMSANNVQDGVSELKGTLDDKVKYLEISVTTTTNNNVSPYGAFGEYTFSTAEKANGTAVSAVPKGITSANPAMCTIRGNNGGIYVYNKTAASITVIVAFVN